VRVNLYSQVIECIAVSVILNCRNRIYMIYINPIMYVAKNAVQFFQILCTTVLTAGSELRHPLRFAHLKMK